MSPNKLTDTQLVLLSAAAQREDGAIGPAEGPKGGLAKKAIGKLLTDGLVEEVPAGGMLPVWRRDDDRGPLALCITPRGLAAIGVEKASALPVAPPLSGKTAEDGEPTPDAPSQGTSAVHKAAPNRRAAARRKRSSDELRQQSAKPRSQACFQAIPRDRNASAGTGQHHRRHRQSNGLAAALSSRVLRRRGAQEARPHARVREDRHRAGLPHSGQESRTQEQGPTQGGMTGSP